MAAASSRAVILAVVTAASIWLPMPAQAQATGATKPPPAARPAAAAPSPAPAVAPGPAGVPATPANVDPARPAYPRRRPGLWEVRSAGSQAAGLPAMQYCVGESTDTAAAHLDRSPGPRGACTLGAFQRAGEAWLSESVCRESKSTVTSRAIASGNFDTEYRIDTLVTYDPPLGGTRREDKDAIAAKWIGPCATGQRPGDMIVPGMGTLNMSDGKFRPEPEPRPPKRRAGAPSRHAAH